MNDSKNKSMKEEETLFENICIEIMNLFEYKKTELLQGSVFLYLFNYIGIYFFRGGFDSLNSQ